MKNRSKLILIILSILVVILLILCLLLVFRNSNSSTNNFEKIAIYGYLEDSVLNVEDLYKLSGNINYNDTEIFQAKLKEALDEYFSNNTNQEVDSSTILLSIDEKYIPDNIDFHGILVSDYEYNFDNNTFVKSPGANSELSIIESSINFDDYSRKKTDVTNLEQIDNTKYKVYFDIIDSEIQNRIDSGEAIVYIDNDTIKIETCSIN